MQISQLTIHYTRTQSLPSYSNVKPGVTITATLEPGEDVFECYTELMNDARELVHGEIDDALEQAGRSPMFTEEPLFWLASNKHRGVVVILPHDLVSGSDLDKLDRQDPNYEHYKYRLGWQTQSDPMRYAAIDRQVAADHASPVFFDCSDGDLSRIPFLPAPPEPEPTDGPKNDDEVDYYSELPEDNGFDEEE